jgi:hypothetical protein
MAPDTGKTRETRLRRLAERRGLRLQKSPRRDPGAWDYGTYQLVDGQEGWLVAELIPGQGFGMSLDDIEEWLTGQPAPMFKITALMKVRPFPAPSAEQRERFTNAIGGLFSRMIMQPSVRWDGDTAAQVILACGGENATTAGERAKEIIDRNAANVAHLYVTGIDVIRVEPLEGHGESRV